MTDDLRSELETALGSAYEIERELTGGGMSRVFAATERALGRRVVIKVLPPDLAAGVNRDRFQREIQLAAQLQHPHIVPLLSAGEHGRLLWYTMPYIDGESLRAAIDRRGRLPVREVVRIISDVTEALSFAHGRGVIHRDIKPGNVLMQGSHALVTDFGVAKALTAALPKAGGTSTGMAIGTPSYMAPEQLASDPSADHRVDLYAVGLLAYELLTGASPFESTSPRETMAAQLTRIPPPLETSNPEVPVALSQVIGRCLQKDPERRPATAEVLLREIDEVASGAIPAQPRRRRVMRMAIAFGAVGVALGATVVLRDCGTVRLEPVAGDPAIAPGEVDTVVVREPVPLQLTRQDSLAIAQAVETRRPAAQGQTFSAAQVESLRIQLERAMAESLSRALAQLQRRPLPEAPLGAGDRGSRGTAYRQTPPAEPVYRVQAPEGVQPPGAPGIPPTVVILRDSMPNRPPPGPPSAIVYPVMLAGAQDPQLTPFLPALQDSLLRVVRGVGGLHVIEVDSLAKLMQHDGGKVAVQLRNSVQVVGHLHQAGQGVMLRVSIRPPGWPLRGRTVSVESVVVPRDQALKAVESVALKLETLLRRVQP